MRTEIQPEECRTEILDIVTRLNYNRILGRLASKRFQLPKSNHTQVSEGELLSVRVSSLMRELPFATSSTAGPASAKQTLKNQLSSFVSACRELEKVANLQHSISVLKSILEIAYSITVDGTQLAAQLQEVGLIGKRLQAHERTIRQLEKLANYWRIALALARSSRSFRKLMVNLTWEAQERYSRVRMPDSVCPRKYVHAEIQLLIHYELNPRELPCRVIGSSKMCCFLCHSLIRAHGGFQITKSHRKVYAQWTVPDLSKFSNETVEKLRRSLKTVEQDINVQFQEYQQGVNRHTSPRNAPAESCINLFLPHYPTPSVTAAATSDRSDLESIASTIRAAASSSRQHTTPLTDPNDQISQVRAGEPSGPPSDGPVEEEQISLTTALESPSSGEVPNGVTELERSSRGPQLHDVPKVSLGPASRTSEGHQHNRREEMVIEMDHGQEKVLTRFDGLGLKLSIGDMISEKNRSASSKKVKSGIIRLQRLPDPAVRGTRILELEDIETGNGITLDRRPTDVLNELRFVLRRGARQPILIRCQWIVEE
jgi:nucleic acid/nucleotide deaminase of polymorphic system toxin